MSNTITLVQHDVGVSNRAELYPDVIIPAGYHASDNSAFEQKSEEQMESALLSKCPQWEELRPVPSLRRNDRGQAVRSLNCLNLE